jgi:glycosyltransferase involved in cell wall biosynthesis
MKEKYCVFFSGEYPCETTLKNEFEIMSSQFDKVFYIPSSFYAPFKKEDFPKNIIPLDIFKRIDEEMPKIVRKHIGKAFRLFFAQLFSDGNFVHYIRSYKTYLTIAATSLEKMEILERLIEKETLPSDTLFYDYWFEDSTLALALLKKRGVIIKAISRTHRFDLYDDAFKGRVPFRRFKVKYLDSVFAVAKHGQEYFKGRVMEAMKPKIKLSYLGVRQPEKIFDQYEEKQEKTIISVSNTQPFKRVHLIPAMLAKFDFPVRWIHFGKGPMDSVIAEEIKKLPVHIRAEQAGSLPNEEILKFYVDNQIDMFVSLSSSEGLPISMMEAISYGVPVFACEVCGIPDLVNETTGALFQQNDSIEVVGEKLRVKLSQKFDKEEILKFSRQNFDYKKNYLSFFQNIEKLL